MKNKNKEIKDNDYKKIIKNLEKENENLDKKCKRALADYHNLSRKVSKEKADIFNYSLEKFFLEILPIYDNLKMAIETLDEKEKNNPWVEGVKYVIKQFKEIFAKYNLKEIKTIGEKFDYNKMEAVKGDSDIIKKELRSGYTFNDKVIIPAKVVLFSKEDLSEK